MSEHGASVSTKHEHGTSARGGEGVEGREEARAKEKSARYRILVAFEIRLGRAGLQQEGG